MRPERESRPMADWAAEFSLGGDGLMVTRAEVESLLSALRGDESSMPPRWVTHPASELEFCAALLALELPGVAAVYNDNNELVTLRGIGLRESR